MKFAFQHRGLNTKADAFPEQTFLACLTKVRGKDLLFDVRDHLRSHFSSLLRRYKARFITSDNN